MRAKAETSYATAYNAKSTAKSAVKPAVNHAAKSVDRESAVAPVVAVLLILAVLMTIISLYSAIYVPALKEQSEIEHLAGVEDTFLLFSSDIESTLISKKEGSITRKVDLGGGSVVLSPLKSGGIMEVKGSDPWRAYRIARADNHTLGESALVDFSYDAVGNFWMDNGYLWDYGVLSLKTPYSSMTPLQYTTYDAAAADIKTNGGIFTPMFDLDYVSEIVFEKDAKGNLTGVTYKNCTEIIFTVVTFDKNKNNDYVSGSGSAALKLDSKMNSGNTHTDRIFVDINTALKDSDNEVVKAADKVLVDTVLKKIEALEEQGFKNFAGYHYDENPRLYTLNFKSPVKVTTRTLKLTISV